MKTRLVARGAAFAGKLRRAKDAESAEAEA